MKTLARLSIAIGTGEIKRASPVRLTAELIAQVLDNGDIFLVPPKASYLQAIHTQPRNSLVGEPVFL